jgi:Carbonic anhydrase
MCLCTEILPTWSVSGSRRCLILGKMPAPIDITETVVFAYIFFLLTVSADMNLLAVLTYAVEQLKVKHILVTGHYDCGGIRAAVKTRNFGQVLDAWLQVSTTLMSSCTMHVLLILFDKCIRLNINWLHCIM